MLIRDDIIFSCFEVDVFQRMEQVNQFFDASAGQRTRYWVDADNATCISELNCANGLDDDGDGDVDLVDTDC